MANLFIALGGTGFKSVSKLQEYCANYAKTNNQQDNNHYLYLDTDETSINPVKSKKNTFVIDLSKFKVVDHYKGDSKNQINIWFDGENITIPQVDLKAGAKGIRQLTRMGFFLHPGAKDVIKTMFDKFFADNSTAIKNNQNNLDALKIYVVSGTAGGTGSGILFDFLYTMWRYYIDNKGMNGNIDVTGVLLMPNLFLKVNDSDLVTKYKLNGFAFFQEINALIKIGLNTATPDQFFNYFNGIKSGVPPAQAWQPFQKAIVIDDSNTRFEFTQKYLYETISDFLFSFTLGKDIYGDKTIADSDGNNFTIQQRLDSALTNAEPNRNLEYIDYFGSYGILIVKSANDYFARYTRNRLKRESIQSVIGLFNNQSEELIEEIKVYIEKKYSEFEQRTPLLAPKTSNKQEKQELVNVLKTLDFNKKMPVAKEPKIKEFITQIESVKIELDKLCNEIKNYLYTLHEVKLTGYSLYAMINAVNKIDNHFYIIWDQNNSLKFDEQTIDVPNTVKSKMMLYYCYMLSKGNQNNNINGYLDLYKDYLESLAKEITLINSIQNTEHDTIITELIDRKANKASVIVPDIDSIICKKGNDYIFNQNGEFVKWYDGIQFKPEDVHKKVIAQIYSNNNTEKKFINFDANYKNDKFRTLFFDVLENTINDTLDLFEYKTIVNKTVYDIISEGNYSIDYFREFDYPFIKLNKPIQASRFVFAGSFNGQDELKSKLGYNDTDINHILIDDLFFKDRIIKIAFHNKISLSDYFLFEQLKNNFAEKFSKLKRENNIVATPFLHKDFAGENFNGDVYGLLLKGGQKVAKDKFEKYSDESKQLIFKYGLIYMYYYVRLGLTSGIFNPSAFQSDFITFDETKKEIQLCEIYYDEIIEMHSVNINKISSTIDVSAEGEKINYQSVKQSIKSAIFYFTMNKSIDLDEKNTIQVALEAYKIFSVQNDDFKNHFGDFFKSFFDLKNKKELKSFLEFYESLF